MNLELAGSSISLSERWRHGPDVLGASTAVEAQEEPSIGFRASVVLTREEAHGSLGEWDAASVGLLASALFDFRLLDQAVWSSQGRSGGRRVVHHVAPNGRAVVLSQWFLITEGWGWTLSSTVDVLRFPSFQDEFEVAAASWRFNVTSVAQ